MICLHLSFRSCWLSGVLAWPYSWLLGTAPQSYLLCCPVPAVVVCYRAALGGCLRARQGTSAHHGTATKAHTSGQPHYPIYHLFGTPNLPYCLSLQLFSPQVKISVSGRKDLSETVMLISVRPVAEFLMTVWKCEVELQQCCNFPWRPRMAFVLTTGSVCARTLPLSLPFIFFKTCHLEERDSTNKNYMKAPNSETKTWSRSDSDFTENHRRHGHNSVTASS